MPRRSDARARMIDAARELIRENGLNATAMSDVLERSGAPRGSVYFHFPGGKTELAVEAALSHARRQVELIDQLAVEAGTAAELIRRYVDAGRDAMSAASFSRGCGLAPLVTEGPHDSAEVEGATGRGFAAMVDRLSSHLHALGVERSHASTLADAAIAGVEGAMVTARAFRRTTPFDAVRDVLVASLDA